MLCFTKFWKVLVLMNCRSGHDYSLNSKTRQKISFEYNAFCVKNALLSIRIIFEFSCEELQKALERGYRTFFTDKKSLAKNSYRLPPIVARTRYFRFLLILENWKIGEKKRKIININDLLYLKLNSTGRLFADDAAFVYQASDFNSLHKMMQKDLV